MRMADLRELRTAAALQGLPQEFDELLAELAALRKDAARYRWLRDDPPWELAVRRKEDHKSELRPVFVYIDGDNLDAAIDAAMRETK